MEAQKICMNCGKKMDKSPQMPQYACAWCGRIITENGTILVRGQQQ
jgi:DNA-directed RNA polymerase subunit RPC12/RpoP